MLQVLTAMFMKVAIIANGELRDPAFHRSALRKVKILICADGGAEHALKLGLKPDYVIGDFDSISKVILNKLRRNKHSKLLKVTDQGSTDLQKALRLALKLKATEIEIYGAIGASSLDHTLANLFCLLEVPKKIKVRVLDKKHTIHLLTGSLSLSLPAGTVVSVMPMDQVTGLSYRGLKWPVKNLNVGPGWLGIRNLAKSNKITVSLKQGHALVIILKK